MIQGRDYGDAKSKEAAQQPRTHTGTAAAASFSIQNQREEMVSVHVWEKGGGQEVQRGIELKDVQETSVAAVPVWGLRTLKSSGSNMSKQPTGAVTHHTLAPYSCTDELAS